MKLLILITVLLIQIFIKITYKKHTYRLIDQYLYYFMPTLRKLKMDQGFKAIIGLLVPPIVLVIFLDALFSHFSLLYFLYASVILWACLDLSDLKSTLIEYFNAFAAVNIVRAQVEAEQFTGRALSANRREIIRSVTEAILFQSITRVFSIIFWFMLLGPLGVVLYFVTAAIADKSRNLETSFYESQNAEYFKGILDWVPIRLVTFTFALISHFGPVFTVWLQYLGDGISENKMLLVNSSLAALAEGTEIEEDVSENQQVLELVSRTFWTWIIVIAVLSVVSWL